MRSGQAVLVPPDDTGRWGRAAGDLPGEWHWLHRDALTVPAGFAVMPKTRCDLHYPPGALEESAEVPADRSTICPKCRIRFDRRATEARIVEVPARSHNTPEVVPGFGVTLDQLHDVWLQRRREAESGPGDLPSEETR